MKESPVTNDIYKQLENQCKSIAKDIENPPIVTEDNIDEYSDVEIGNPISAYDYLESNLGIEFTVNLVNGSLIYQSGSITVAYGGPTIEVKTDAYNNKVKVCGYWGNAKVIINTKDTMGIGEYLKEFYERYK